MMTYILPADFIELDFARFICAGLLTVLHNGKPVADVEQADNAYWLRGRSGTVRTIIDRVSAETQLEVCRKGN